MCMCLCARARSHACECMYITPVNENGHEIEREQGEVYGRVARGEKKEKWCSYIIISK